MHRNSCNQAVCEQDKTSSGVRPKCWPKRHPSWNFVICISSLCGLGQMCELTDTAGVRTPGMQHKWSREIGFAAGIHVLAGSALCRMLQLPLIYSHIAVTLRSVGPHQLGALLRDCPMNGTRRGTSFNFVIYGMLFVPRAHLWRPGNGKEEFLLPAELGAKHDQEGDRHAHGQPCSKHSSSSVTTVPPETAVKLT